MWIATWRDNVEDYNNYINFQQHEEKLAEAQRYADEHDWTYREWRLGVEFFDTEGFSMEDWYWEE